MIDAQTKYLAYSLARKKGIFLCPESAQELLSNHQKSRTRRFLEFIKNGAKPIVITSKIPGGSGALFPPIPAIILSSDSDETTYLHELGHFFTDPMDRVTDEWESELRASEWAVARGADPEELAAAAMTYIAEDDCITSKLREIQKRIGPPPVRFPDEGLREGLDTFIDIWSEHDPDISISNLLSQTWVYQKMRESALHESDRRL